MKFVASQSTCLKRMYLLILVVSLIPLHAAAQMDQGSIVGSIRDATGAVIPGRQSICKIRLPHLFWIGQALQTVHTSSRRSRLVHIR